MYFQFYPECATKYKCIWTCNFFGWLKIAALNQKLLENNQNTKVFSFFENKVKTFVNSFVVLVKNDEVFQKILTVLFGIKVGAHKSSSITEM